MIDLRSDTVTQPTAEMLEAMYAARLGGRLRKSRDTAPELTETTGQVTLCVALIDMRVPAADIVTTLAASYAPRKKMTRSRESACGAA